MGRGRNNVIVKKISSVSKDDSETLHTMFAQMTGAHDAEPEVIIPKIINIYKKIIKYNILFNTLLNFKEFTNKFQEYTTWFNEIRDFLEKLIQSTNTDIKKDYDLEIFELHKKDPKKLNEFYKDFKNNEYIKKIIITGSNLSIFKKYLNEESDIDDSFINREPGISLKPLDFSDFDLKLLWNSENITNAIKKFILSIIKHTYKIGVEMYDIVTSPDVDIKKFSIILVESIGKMRKQIPRCDKAFDVIENSVKMLETNFTSYYRSSVEAENPSVIVENFIVDISTSQKANATVTSQFRKIVNYLKEKGSQNNDPKVKKLFGMLNNQFTTIDKELGVKDVVEKMEETKLE